MKYIKPTTYFWVNGTYIYEVYYLNWKSTAQGIVHILYDIKSEAILTIDDIAFSEYIYTTKELATFKIIAELEYLVDHYKTKLS